MGNISNGPAPTGEDMKRRDLLKFLIVEGVLILILLILIPPFRKDINLPIPEIQLLAADKIIESLPLRSNKEEELAEVYLYEPDDPETVKVPTYGSSPQEDILTFVEYIYLVQRAHTVLYNILRNNQELVKNREKGLTYAIGIHTMTNVHFSENLRDMVRKDFNIGDGLTVVNVAESSPASRAGIQTYDRILAVNKNLVRKHPIKTLSQYQWVRDSFNDTLNDHFSKSNYINLVILRRDGTRHVINVVPEVVCKVRFNVPPSQVFDAFASARRSITITTGTIETLEKDSELAMVLGHELAHITRGHRGKKLAGSYAGALVGKVIEAKTGINPSMATSRIGGMLFSHKYELEADYFGLYHAARAGYDVKEATDFWKRLATTKTTSKAVGFDNLLNNIQGRLSHPPDMKRFDRLTATAKEIQVKADNNQPLVPSKNSST